MRRREFIAGRGCVAAWPRAALAQPGEYKKVYGDDILPGYVPDGQLVETDALY